MLFLGHAVVIVRAIFYSKKLSLRETTQTNASFTTTLQTLIRGSQTPSDMSPSSVPPYKRHSGKKSSLPNQSGSLSTGNLHTYYSSPARLWSCARGLSRRENWVADPRPCWYLGRLVCTSCHPNWSCSSWGDTLALMFAMREWAPSLLRWRWMCRRCSLVWEYLVGLWRLR